ncbi:MAG TPA: hypothetical protein VE736_09170 [Gaiellaceae bacterium]|jgi:hypothetical protein|nr:hypothetical protein [Gaiellaceae bacterium]
MVGAGDPVGGVRLWTAPGERQTVSELVGDEGALFLFYLFDWSST